MVNEMSKHFNIFVQLAIYVISPKLLGPNKSKQKFFFDVTRFSSQKITPELNRTTELTI